MGKKSGSFNKDGIGELAKDKPVVYKIEDKKGKNIYTGVAKRGRVEERLKEHLPGAKDAIRGGVKVKIQQKSSIAEAVKSEAKIIKREKPPQNKKGKSFAKGPSVSKKSPTSNRGGKKQTTTNSGGPRKTKSGGPRKKR